MDGDTLPCDNSGHLNGPASDPEMPVHAHGVHAELEGSDSAMPRFSRRSTLLHALFVFGSWIASADVQGESCTAWTRLTDHPGFRSGTAMAYDSDRQIVVLFGGTGGSPTSGRETWEWNGETWNLRSVIGPSQRSGHAMAYDKARHVVVLFGPNSETWEWDGHTWAWRSNTGPEPWNTNGHSYAMAYDSARGITVHFGGPNGSTWEWDGADWVLQPASGPSPRVGHAMAYDEVRNRTILFGGAGGNLMGDTWEWNGSFWSQVSPSGATPRWNHAMAFDPSRNVAVLYGGQGQFSVLSDTWEWDGSTWTQRLGSAAGQRSMHAMAFDGMRNGVLLFGARESTPPETWEWDGLVGSWNPVVPCPRVGLGIVFDEARAVTVMMGGADGSGYRQDIWELEDSVWMLRSPLAMSPPRSDFATTFDGVRATTLLFGGLKYIAGSNFYSSDTLGWDGSTLSMLATAGPAPRSESAMAFDRHRGVAVLFGGHDDGGTFADTWEWSGIEWMLRSTSGPPPRYGHGMAYDSGRDVTVMFGGSYDGFLGDTWEWNGVAWTHRDVSGPPSRSHAVMAFDEDRGVVVLFGGYTVNVPPITATNTWEWNGESWTELAITSPEPRGGSAMAYDSVRNRLVLFGGTGGGFALGDTWEYAPVVSPVPSQPVADEYASCPGSCYAPTNRYLTFAPPLVPAGATGVALRVTFTAMPSSGQCPHVPDFSAFTGTEMWVGPEVLQGGTAPTGVFELQPTPLFRDWSTVTGGVLHVSDCNILPCSTYTIEAVADTACDLSEPSVYSTPLTLDTTRVWGDIIGPLDSGTGAHRPPDGLVNFMDISSMVDRFADRPNAPPGTWCDVYANRPSQGVSGNINFLDISTVVEAFKGRDYPFAGPAAPNACSGVP